MVVLASTFGATYLLDTTVDIPQLLVIIDPKVDNYDELAAGVIDGSEVHILEPDRDGIDQITELLQPYSSGSTPLSLHIVSHGSPGCVYLGNSCLSLETIDRYAWDLQSWFPHSALSTQYSLLLYGCSVAAGDAGNEFLQKLHHLTRANIAASNTPTGNAALGGDWDLAVRLSDINPKLAFQAETIAAYVGVLEKALFVGPYGSTYILNSNNLTDFKFEMRVRMNSYNTNSSGPFPNLMRVVGTGNDNATSSGGWKIVYDTNAQALYLEAGGTMSYYVSCPEFSRGEWVTIGVQHIPGRAPTDFYINGSYITSAPGACNTTADIYFGGVEYFQGLGLFVDDVRLSAPTIPETPLAYINFETYDPYIDSSPYLDNNLGGSPDLTGNGHHILIPYDGLDPYAQVKRFDLNRPPTGVYLNSNTIPENSLNGTTVGYLYTNDPDPGDSFTYTLLNDAGGRFLISGNQLYSINSSLLNYEAKTSHDILVRTTDRAGAFCDQYLTINLLDVNEAPTNITLSPANINENVDADTIVGSLSSTDPDANNSFSYQIVAGTGDTDNDKFELVGNQIKLKESPDFETQPTYSIRVRTTDQNGLSFDKQLAIAVNDRNDAPLDLSLSDDSVDENITSDTTAATFITLDPDANESLTYSLVNGEGDTDNAAFQIVGNQLHFINLPNYETQSSYNLRVKVTDKGGLSIEQPLRIAINDVNETPTSLTLSNTTIDENGGSGVQVGTFAATDPDTGDILTYSLVDGVGGQDNTAFKIIDNQLHFINNPNYEAQSTYSIRVGVIDAKGLSLEKTFSVTLNDLNDAPTDLDLSNSAIADGVLVNSVVGTFSTADQDANEQFTYELVSGFGDTDNAAFTLIDNELRINRSPNFDTQSDYSIRVRTTDKGGASFEKVIQLVVSKDNDAPTGLSISQTSIDENNTVNALVGALSSVDPNPGNTFTYSLIGGSGSTDNATFVIIGNDLILKSPANYETKPSYNIRIRTTDQGGASFDKAFTIGVKDVNEAPTGLNLSNSAIAENSTPEVLVGALSSVDADANNSFTYNLIAGTGDTDNGVFTIAGDQLYLKASPNFEVKPSYKIRVRTTDQDGAFLDKVLTVRVTDVNEAPTNLSLSSSSINENVPVNTVVGKLASVDPDAKNTFAYSLVDGAGDTDNASFTIAGNELRIQTSPDFETKSAYNLRIRTTDQNGSSFEKPLTIQVKNVNEAPIGFILSNNKLNESAAAGTVVGTLRTLDPDASNTFTYALVDGTGSTNNANFTILGNQLRFQSTPAGAPPTFSIRIRTTDQNGLSFEEPATIQVNAAPTDILLSNTRITENEPANSVIGNLVAIDRNNDDTHTYQLVSGSGDKDNSAFAIVNNQLILKPSPDFEKQSSYNVRVQATDQAGATFQKSLEITVGNINDAPSSLKLGYSIIPENQIQIIPIIAVDQDVLDQGRLRYFLTNGAGSEDNSAFYIQGTNLIPSTPANYEQKSTYSVRLRVQDVAGAYLEQPFTISIKDINEPATSIALTNDHISENVPANSVVGYITGFDPDAGDSLTYNLVQGYPDSAAFAIQGNQLIIKSSPDFEAKSSYEIWIQATDRAGLPYAKPFTINIDDQTETGIPVLETGDVKSSLRLDGNFGYVKIAKESTFDITNAITVEGWFKADRWDRPWQAIITKGDSAWRIARAGESNSLEFAVGSGSSGMVVQGNKPVNDGSWHHVAGVYDGSTLKLYVDGNLDGEKQVSGPIATNDYDVWLGANAEQPGRNFAGQLDEFRVWNIARSQTDIQTAKRQKIDPSTPGLVGYWQLNDGTGVTIASSKAGDNNGTLVNSDGTSWSETSPVLARGDNEYQTWSQLSTALDQFSSQGNSLGLGTKDVLRLMFSVFEAGELDPDNTVTAIANLASNKIELSTARSASVVDLAQLMDTVAQFAGISAPESALSVFRNIPIPMLDSTLTISNLGAPLPTYQFSTRVSSASNIDGLNFLKVVQDYLDIKDFTLTARVDPLALSAKLTANLVADKTIFDVAGFQIAFLGGELATAIDKANPSITLKPILKLKNYDPFQSGEPDLTLNGTLYFDPDAFVAGLQLSAGPGNAWKNPFGIPDSELRNVGFELGGTFETPYVRQVKVLGDLKFGNYDIKAGFIVHKKDDKKNAIALTINKPLNAIDLFYGPVRSFALNQLADQIPIVQDGLKFLNQIVPLNLVSIDGNRDGTLDPLISFSREATSIVGQKIKAGLSINGELTAWGKTATLIVDCDLSNTLNPTLTGSLTIPQIDWGFLKLSGVNQPNLSLKFDARFAQTSRLNIPVVGVSLPTSLNAYLSGSASLNLFGRNVASADFYLDTNRININRFNLDAGPLRLELSSLNFDFRRFDGSGSGQIKLFDQKIAEGSFLLNNGNFFATGRLGMSIFGKDVGVDARISLGEKGNYIQLNASALGYTKTLVNSSLDPFVSQFKTLDDLKNTIINQIPALKTAGEIYNTAKSWFGLDGYLANSTVFFDANLNGILDDSEPFTTTDAGGGFDLPVDLIKFDTNKNQQIDSSEGKYVLMGGTDISTALPLITPLSAVVTPSSTAITPLTTIIAEVVQQQGIDPKLAQTRVKAALGLTSTVDLTNFDPLQAIANGDAKGASIFAAMVMVQNTIVQAAKFANGVSSDLVAELANGAIAAIANQVKDGTPVDFGKAETIQSIVQNTLAKAAVSDPGINLSQLSTIATAAAQAIALGNQMTQELVISGRPAKEIALEITRLQAVSSGQVADELTQLAAGKIAPEEFLAQTTRDAILKQAAEVQVNDPTIRPGLEAATKNLRLVGSNRDDVLGGNLGNDIVIGKKGNDSLRGNGGNDRLQGDQGNDNLTGGSGSDRLTGGDGNDILSGGDGNDILLGGAGRDRFAINVAETGKDKIIDFSIRDDLLRIDGLLGGFKHGKPISARQFHLGNKAADRSDRFIYNTRNGALFYDADGLGGSRQIQIAQLSKGLALTAHHILVS